jgi:hypothetical protein
MADWSPIYKTGTATLTNGQTAVTGQGTSWNTAGLRAGDQIKAAGFSVTIAAINTNGTGLTLAEGWPGVTRTALPYEILRVSDADRLIAAHADLMAALVPNLTSLGGLTLAANKGIHATGAGAMATHDLTAFMRGVLGSADGSAARQTLGANDAANLNAGILPAARLPFVAGTWTPVLSGATTNPTATYTMQQGNYVKLGRYVYIHWRLDANVSNVGAGNLEILGMPFMPSFTASPITLGIQTLFSGTGATADCHSSRIRILGLDGSAITTSILKTGVTGILIGGGIYATAA